jgi:hypothetical protein
MKTIPIIDKVVAADAIEAITSVSIISSAQSANSANKQIRGDNITHYYSSGNQDGRFDPLPPSANGG